MVRKGILFLFALIGCWYVFLFFFSTVYPISTKVTKSAEQKTKENHATYLPLQRIPSSFQMAVISTEDRRFYEHFGIDPIGVVRSMMVDIQSDKWSEGGSTITQQLVRNTVLTQEKTLKRKLEEALFAIALEQFMSKQKILELYLNVIYYGHGAYGAEEAAKTYFGKSLDSLNLAEWALLAGLPNAPSELDPYKNINLAKQRQKEVLDNMEETDFITQEQEKEALGIPLNLIGREQ